MNLGKTIFEFIIIGLEYAGAGIIAGGVIFAAINTIINLVKKLDSEKIYRSFRTQIGRCILLGLELLVAADIISTVTVELTLRSVGLLVILVLIRTFLSFTLEVEMFGKWPWQNK